MLLIVAALDDGELAALHDAARGLDLDCLVEVHDEPELERALAIDADVLGINNRNLDDFSVDVGTTLELITDVPAGKAVVSESGISDRSALEELEERGVDAVLIGEALMRAAGPGGEGARAHSRRGIHPRASSLANRQEIEMATQTQIVNGVDFVALPTKDYEASKKFYTEVLGLPFGKQWGSMPAGEFETGSLTIAVMQADGFGMEFSPNKFPVEFHVDDWDSAYSELESRGVEFQGETIDSGVCKQAFFEDPDGNLLAIHHRYAEGAPPGESS